MRHRRTALGEAAQWDNPGRANPLLLTGRGTPDERFDGILHRCGADLILELERVQPGVVVTSVGERFRNSRTLRRRRKSVGLRRKKHAG